VRIHCFHVTDELVEHIQYQKGQYCIVEAILDIRSSAGVTELQVQWRGFDDEDPTWVPINELSEDIPAMVSDFISEIKSSGTSRQRKLVQNY